MELDELTLKEDDEPLWKETARWIKFEEDLEEGADRWGKPHAATLSFHSLLSLRKCIEQGKNTELCVFSWGLFNLLHFVKCSW